MSTSIRRMYLTAALCVPLCGLMLTSYLHAQFQPQPFGPGPGIGPAPGIGPGPGFGPNMGPRFPPFNNQPNNMNPGGLNPNFGGGPRLPSLDRQWVCSGCGASLGNGLRPAGMCAGCGAKIINGSGGPAGGNFNLGPGALNPGNAGPGLQNPPLANQPGGMIPAIPPLNVNPQQNQLPQAPAENAAPPLQEQPQQLPQQQIEMPPVDFQAPLPAPAAGSNPMTLYIVAAVLATLTVIAVVALFAAKAAGAF